MNSIDPTKQRKRERPRALDGELGELAVDMLLKNWARWASGHPASVGYVTGSEHGSGLVPVEDAARAMEIILLKLKRQRPRFWGVVWHCYIARYGDDAAASATRVSVEEYRSLLLRSITWIAAVWENAGQPHSD